MHTNFRLRLCFDVNLVGKYKVLLADIIVDVAFVIIHVDLLVA